MPPVPTRPSSLDRAALIEAILDLEEGRPAPILDPALAVALGRRTKPYIDQLITATAAAGAAAEAPEDHDESSEVTPPLADDEAYDDGLTAGPVGTGDDLEAEAVAEEDGADEWEEAPAPRPPRPALPQLEGPAPELAQLDPEERARWLFLERFVPLDRLQQILGYPLAAADLARYREDLGRLLDELLMLPPTAVAWSRNDAAGLQRRFASMVLLLRHPFIADAHGDPVPCSLRNLRERFADYFYRRYRVPNWYEDQPFYSDPLPRAGWVVCETEYLNCTLRRADRKLAAYARQWFLGPEQVAQKTVVEDVYDRIVCGEAVGEDLFETNCSSCTATVYAPAEGGPARTAFTVQKNRKVAVHGKTGVPHWKASRRLWPGVFPTLVWR